MLVTKFFADKRERARLKHYNDWLAREAVAPEVRERGREREREGEGESAANMSVSAPACKALCAALLFLAYPLIPRCPMPAAAAAAAARYKPA